MSRFLQPPGFDKTASEPRRAGFELEFGNLTVRETAEMLQQRLGGEIEEENPFRLRLVDTVIADLKIERDTEILTSTRYRKLLAQVDFDEDVDKLINEVEQGVDRLSSWLIPCEVVTEPLPFEKFPHLDEIAAALHELEGRGTQRSFLYAFGLHINPSLPDRETTTLVAFLQAYLLLSDWLIAEARVDFSRRFLTSYIDPFPDPFVEKVLDAGYRPEDAEFCSDYLEYNPTRNRSLDLLPILYDRHEEAVEAAVDDKERPLLSARPAFHYRLPDCRLGDDDWSVAEEWNRWWCVEQLAAADDLRMELIERAAKNREKFFLTRKKSWLEYVDEFVDRHFPAPEEDDG